MSKTGYNSGKHTDYSWRGQDRLNSAPKSDNQSEGYSSTLKDVPYN